ncbi:MAG: putative Ig domain-containing protein [Candidatus Zixiibacteriota bacterium]
MKGKLNGWVQLLVIGIVFGLAVNSQAQYSISGIVTDSNLVPVPSVKIFLYDAQGNSIGIPPITTDISGFYSIPGLPTGVYGVGFEPLKATGLLAILITPVAVNNNVTLNAVLPAGDFVTGYVRDSLGLPIPNIDLNVYDQATGIKLYTHADNTDINGFYSILIPDGIYRIRWRPISGERWVTVEYQNVTITNDTTIDITMYSGYYVSGTVLDSFGSPVYQCNLDFIDVYTGIKLTTPGGVTDASGFFQIVLPGGLFNAAAKPPVALHLAAGEFFNVPVNNDTSLAFTLMPGFSLSGFVRDINGDGVFNADIDVKDASTGIKLLTPYDKTDTIGFYEVIVPSGFFNLIYQPKVTTYLAPAESLGVSITSDIVVDITVQNGILLSGIVQNTSGLRVPGINIDVVEPSTLVNLPLLDDYTNDTGYFGVIIVPGIYHIDIQPPKSSRLVSKRLYDISLLQDTSIFETVDTGVMVSGTVTLSGSPVTDVEACAILTSNGDTVFTPGNRTDSIGYYEIVVTSGTYHLLYKPDSLSGIPDTTMLANVPVVNDTVINVALSSIPNTPPTLVPIGPQSTTEGVLLSFPVSATDAESTPVLTTSTLPPGASFVDNNNGTGDFNWMPNSTQSGNYSVTFYATDAGLLVDSEIVGIEVIDSGLPNTPPTLNPIGPKSTTEAILLYFPVTATDAESTPVLTTSSLPPGATFVDYNDGTGDFIWIPNYIQSGNYSVTFYATDAGQLVDSENVGIEVIESGINECCIGIRGNINGDPNDDIDIADLVYFVDYSFSSPPGPEPPCPKEADVDGGGGVDIGDIVYMVDYMFSAPPGPAPVNCL